MTYTVEMRRENLAKARAMRGQAKPVVARSDRRKFNVGDKISLEGHQFRVVITDGSYIQRATRFTLECIDGP